MGKESLSNSVMLYGLFPPRKLSPLPEFPHEFPYEFPKLKETKKMDDVKKFIKLLRKNINAKTGYIEKKDMDTIILDTLEEMNDNNK